MAIEILFRMIIIQDGPDLNLIQITAFTDMFRLVKLQIIGNSKIKKLFFVNRELI